MEWKHFEDKETQDGVRGRWSKVGPTLTVYIKPPHSKRSLRRMKIDDDVKVNRDDLRCAQWVVEFLTDHIDKHTQDVNVGGYARGSAVAQIVTYKLLKLYPFLRIHTILTNTQKTGNKTFVDSIWGHVTSIIPEYAFLRWVWLWPWYRLGATRRKSAKQQFSHFHEIHRMR